MVPWTKCKLQIKNTWETETSRPNIWIFTKIVTIDYVGARQFYSQNTDDIHDRNSCWISTLNVFYHLQKKTRYQVFKMDRNVTRECPFTEQACEDTFIFVNVFVLCQFEFPPKNISCLCYDFLENKIWFPGFQGDIVHVSMAINWNRKWDKIAKWTD